MNGASWLKVTFCLPTGIVSGFTYLYDNERLLDVLNGVSTRRPESRERAMELTDATVTRPDGREENWPTVYLNKPSICLAATWEQNGGRGILAKTSWKEYPFVEKLAVPVRVELSVFTLSGRMHLARGQMASHLLDEKVLFLPMTSVAVHPPSNRLWSDVAFVAVNREQILSLQQQDIPLLNLGQREGSISHN